MLVASCIALAATAVGFGTRGGFINPWMQEFNLSGAQVGWIVGAAFWGVTIAHIVLGPLVDVIGMKRIINLAFFSHLASLILMISATGFWSLFASTLFIGIANGCIEAVCNPLITALFPDDKATRLNQFHVWFPAGIVIGGLVVYFFNMMGLGWRFQTATMFLPTFAYGFLFMDKKFPVTERVAIGFSYRDMLKACISPLFLFMVFAMLLTSSTELGTNQWIAALMEVVAVPGILLLVWVSGLIALARMFAAPVVHRLKSTGVLLLSSVLAALGLYLLSLSSGYWTFAAAGVFALGVAYFWPNMLGVVAEKVPASGALGLAIMGVAGGIGGAVAQPALGKIYDNQLLKYQGNKLLAGAMSLRYVIIIVLILIAAFTYLHFFRKSAPSEIENPQN